MCLKNHGYQYLIEGFEPIMSHNHRSNRPLSGWAYWFIPNGSSWTPYLARRLVARFVDLAAVWALTRAIVWVISKLFVLVGSSVISTYAMTMLVILTVWEQPSTAIWGRTVGKLAAGIRVVRRGSEEPPGWGRATLRWLMIPGVLIAGVLIAGIPLVSGPLGLLAIVVLANGWHDRLARTTVACTRQLWHGSAIDGKQAT